MTVLRFRRMIRLMFIPPLLLMGSCSSGTSTKFADTVEGIVTLDNVPVPNLRIEFVPDLPTGAKAPNSGATTDEKGFYRLNGNDTGKPGAAIAKHRVIVFPGRPDNAPRDRDDDGSKAPVPKSGLQIPPVYLNAAKTRLLIEIKADQKTYDLKMTSKP